MPTLQVLSASEQVAAHLRRELARGVWTGVMPGEHRLVAELGVSHNTVKAALRQLEREDLLLRQGVGKQRQISSTAEASSVHGLTVGILPYVLEDTSEPYFKEVVTQLQEAGCQPEVAGKTLTGLGLKLRRIQSYVAQHPADAWVVTAGPRDVLEWFAKQSTPAFALFGRNVGVPIAATYPHKSDAAKELIERLIAFGHSRIVLLAHEERRKPNPGFVERLMLETMEAHGIRTGSYNLPDWEESQEGLHEALDSLFRHTPPSALIVDDPYFFVPVLQYLAGIGLTAPEKISLACLDKVLGTSWCQPAITHITWESHPLAKRVADWARRVSQGKEDRRRRPLKARLALGGTIGPAKLAQ